MYTPGISLELSPLDKNESYIITAYNNNDNKKMLSKISEATN